MKAPVIHDYVRLPTNHPLHRGRRDPDPYTSPLGGKMNRFWNGPERGPTGDHGQAGQDGRDGRAGDPGPQGPVGRVTQGERGQRGRQGGSTRGLRLRMLTLYLTTVVLICAVGFVYQRDKAEGARFDQRVVTNCQAGQANAVNFNKFLDALVQTYTDSQYLTDREKANRVEIFEAAKSTVPECPLGKGS